MDAAFAQTGQRTAMSSSAAPFAPGRVFAGAVPWAYAQVQHQTPLAAPRLLPQALPHAAPHAVMLHAQPHGFASAPCPLLEKFLPVAAHHPLARSQPQPLLPGVQAAGQPRRPPQKLQLLVALGRDVSPCREAPRARRAPEARGRRQAAPGELAPSDRSGGLPTGASVAGRVWELSQDARGCHLVQQALEDAGSDDARAALTRELYGHVWEAMKCRHANHVLQKCVTTMRAQAVQFIIYEISKEGATVRKAARHQYGCRVLQRLLEHCQSSQVGDLVESLLLDALAIAKHAYGNYVIQHVFEHGTEDQRRRLGAQLRDHALTLGRDSKGCAVLGKALSYGVAEDRAALAWSLLREPGLLPAMACSRHGHTVAKLVLEMSEEREEAQRQLEESLPALSASRYGRSVVTFLRAFEQDGRCP